MVRICNMNRLQFNETKAMIVAYKICWLGGHLKGDHTKQPHLG